MACGFYFNITTLHWNQGANSLYNASCGYNIFPVSCTVVVATETKEHVDAIIVFETQKGTGSPNEVREGYRPAANDTPLLHMLRDKTFSDML